MKGQGEKGQATEGCRPIRRKLEELKRMAMRRHQSRLHQKRVA